MLITGTKVKTWGSRKGEIKSVADGLVREFIHEAGWENEKKIVCTMCDGKGYIWATKLED